MYLYPVGNQTYIKQRPGKLFPHQLRNNSSIPLKQPLLKQNYSVPRLDYSYIQETNRQMKVLSQ